MTTRSLTVDAEMSTTYATAAVTAAAGGSGAPIADTSKSLNVQLINNGEPPFEYRVGASGPWSQLIRHQQKDLPVDLSATTVNLRKVSNSPDGAAAYFVEKLTGRFFDVETAADLGIVSQDPVTGALTVGGVAVSGGARKSRLPRALTVASVMASPPSTTYTTSHTIASPRPWLVSSAGLGGTTGGAAFTGGSFTYSKAGAPTIRNTGYPSYNFAKMQSVNYGSSGSGQIANVEQWSFRTYSTAIELLIYDAGAPILVKINDQYISFTPQATTSSGTPSYLYIPFGSLDVRRVDVITSSAQGGVFGGVYTAQGETVEPAENRGSGMLILADSYLEAPGSTYGALQNYAVYMSDALVFDNVMSSGVGARGFLAAPGGKLTYRQALATDVFPFAASLDYVFFQLSINDNGSTIAALQAEWALTIAAVRAVMPNVVLGFIGTMYVAGAGYTPAIYWQMSDAGKAFCAANNMLFISACDQSMQPGSTPQSTTLAALVATSASSISTALPLTIGEVYKFADGSRFLCTGVSGSGPYGANVDNISVGQASGATVTQAGRSIFTGNGQVGTTTGNGTCDTEKFSDGTHPTTAGEKNIGIVLASEFLRVAQASALV